MLSVSSALAGAASNRGPYHQQYATPTSEMRLSYDEERAGQYRLLMHLRIGAEHGAGFIAYVEVLADYSPGDQQTLVESLLTSPIQPVLASRRWCMYGYEHTIRIDEKPEDIRKA